MKSIVAAFKFLTIFSRLIHSQPTPALVGTASVLFPVVGVVIGVSLVLLTRALQNYLDAEILSTTIVAFLVLVTGGVHLEGLKKTFDASVETTGGGEQFIEQRHWVSRDCLRNTFQNQVAGYPRREAHCRFITNSCNGALGDAGFYLRFTSTQ
jgi:hypothetical protein